MTQISKRPASFDRRHAVASGVVDTGPSSLTGDATPYTLSQRALHYLGLGLNNNSLWVPLCKQMYAPILDHGIRPETKGIVLHVNDGEFEGTIGFFTNGQPEPYGSEGVGAHFEFGGRSDAGIPNSNQIVQFLPLDRVAWHNVDGNGSTIGFEHAGFGYSTYEWETEHRPMIANSAYRAAWILHRFNLGYPVYSENLNSGNIWPHHAGGASWGGHICPNSTRDGKNYFPIELWLQFANKAYRERWMRR